MSNENFLGQNVIYSSFSAGNGISISRKEDVICISNKRENNVKRKEIHLSPDSFSSFLGELRANIKLLNMHLESDTDFQQTFGTIRFLQRNKQFYIAEKGQFAEHSPNEILVPKDVLLTFKKDIEKRNIHFEE